MRFVRLSERQIFNSGGEDLSIFGGRGERADPHPQTNEKTITPESARKSAPKCAKTFIFVWQNPQKSLTRSFFSDFHISPFPHFFISISSISFPGRGISGGETSERRKRGGKFDAFRLKFEDSYTILHGADLTENDNLKKGN